MAIASRSPRESSERIVCAISWPRCWSWDGARGKHGGFSHDVLNGLMEPLARLKKDSRSWKRINARNHQTQITWATRQSRDSAPVHWDCSTAFNQPPPQPPQPPPPHPPPPSPPSPPPPPPPSLESRTNSFFKSANRSFGNVATPKRAKARGS